MSDIDFETLNYFRGDSEIHQDPYPYYEWLRARGPVWHHPRGVVFITGYEEAIAVYRDPATWSNCNTVSGPFFKFSVPLEGDDLTEIIEEHRGELPFSDQLPSFDPPMHTAHRGLLMRLITPKRLKHNEVFMWAWADQTIDEFIGDGECELIQQYAVPFTVMVVADLLGVPVQDRDAFLENLVHTVRAARLEHKPLEYLYEQFTRYIEDRRANPRDDIMTEMAHATFPDGTLPPVEDVMRIAANQFENPTEFRVDRVNGRQHLGFGHGIHSCAGAPLARAETHATITRFLDRMSEIRTSETHHGPIDARRYTYDSTHMMRGVTELHLEFTPVDTG